MTANLAPIIGPAESTSGDHSDCSTLAANAVLRLRHPGASIAVLDNADLSELSAAILAPGYPDVSAIWGYSDAISYAAAMSVITGDSLAYPVMLVQCDSNAQPVAVNGGPLRHYLDPFSTDGMCYQCWTAEDIEYSNLAAAYCGVCIIRFTAPPSPSSPLRRDMSAQYYTGADGHLHRAGVDANGVLTDANTATGEEHVISRDVLPLGSVTAITDASGVQRITCDGKQGDLPEFVFPRGGPWSQSPPYKQV